MKKFLAAFGAAFLLAGTMLGQTLSYTPPAASAYIYNGTNWSAWASALGAGQLGYVPPAVGLYCQASVGGAWTPCNPSNPYSALQPSPVFRYDMTPGNLTSTALQDVSGNNYNCAWNNGQPTHDTTGLILDGNHGCNLPAAVTTGTAVRTFVAAYYSKAIVNPDLLVQAQSQWDFNLWGGANALVHTYNGNSGSPANIDMDACQIDYGRNVLVWVQGTNTTTNPDHLYINGQECPAYTAAQWMAVFSGTLSLFTPFTSPAFGSGNGLNGNAYFVEAFGTALTAAQVLSETLTINALLAQRGVPSGPVPVMQSMPHIFAVADSIDSGVGSSSGNTSWIGHLTLTNQPAYVLTNYGSAGAKLSDLRPMATNREGLYCRTAAYQPSNIIERAGINDIINGTSAAVLAANMARYVQDMKRAGCTVFVGTLLDTFTNTSVIDAYNVLVRQQAVTDWGADGVVDFASDPCLGADGSSGTSGTPGACFSDGLHPNESGYTKMGAEASRVLNYRYGYSDRIPHVLSAGAYTMADADGTVEVPAGVTGAVTLTLPNCNGPSGARYRITNLQSTYAVTVTGMDSTQPIHGLTTAQTVPANSSLVLTIIPYPAATAGCHWE